MKLLLTILLFLSTTLMAENFRYQIIKNKKHRPLELIVTGVVNGVTVDYNIDIKYLSDNRFELALIKNGNECLNYKGIYSEEVAMNDKGQLFEVQVFKGVRAEGELGQYKVSIDWLDSKKSLVVNLQRERKNGEVSSERAAYIKFVKYADIDVDFSLITKKYLPGGRIDEYKEYDLDGLEVEKIYTYFSQHALVEERIFDNRRLRVENTLLNGNLIRTKKYGLNGSVIEDKEFDIASKPKPVARNIWDERPSEPRRPAPNNNYTGYVPDWASHSQEPKSYPNVEIMLNNLAHASSVGKSYPVNRNDLLDLIRRANDEARPISQAISDISQANRIAGDYFPNDNEIKRDIERANKKINERPLEELRANLARVWQHDFRNSRTGLVDVELVLDHFINNWDGNIDSYGNIRTILQGSPKNESGLFDIVNKELKELAEAGNELKRNNLMEKLILVTTRVSLAEGIDDYNGIPNFVNYACNKVPALNENFFNGNITTRLPISNVVALSKLNPRAIEVIGRSHNYGLKTSVLRIVK